MADESSKSKTATGPRVSPARTIVSLVVLLIVGIVCVIELRAGVGQMMSGKALGSQSKDGEFSKLSLEEARGMMSLAPKETVENRGPDSCYHFEWFSLLRPLMGQQSPKLTIVATNDETPMALAYFAAEDEQPIPVSETADSGLSGPPPGTMGPGGMMPGGGGGPGAGGGMSMGGGPGSQGPGSGSQRPPLEEAAETPATETPGASETPASEAPAETPAAEAPSPAN